MIRKDPSLVGKTDKNGTPSSVPSGTPLTVLRPVTVLPSGSNVATTTNSNGSPVVYLLASPNPRLNGPQHNSVGTPQSGHRVLLLQIPSKTSQGATVHVSTPQSQKIVNVSSAGSNSVPTKRPMIVQRQITTSTPPNVSFASADDVAPPVKRFSISSSLGSLIKPVNIHHQSVGSSTSTPMPTTPSIKIVQASNVTPQFTNKGANLVRLEQARTAARVCATEAQQPRNIILPTPSPKTEPVVPQSRASPAVSVVSRISNTTGTSMKRTPEVKVMSLLDQAIIRCISHDRKVVSSQLVPGHRLPTWSKMSEAVLALIPFHIYHTPDPPLVDRLEHDVSFAARCQRLLERKEKIRKRLCKIIYNEPLSRETLDDALMDQLLIESIQNPLPEQELQDGVKQEETESMFNAGFSCGDANDPIHHRYNPLKEAPKLKIKLSGSAVPSPSATNSPVSSSRGALESEASTYHCLKNNFTDDEDSNIPPADDGSSLFWNNPNSGRESFFISHNSLATEDSADGTGGLSEADLAVQSIL